MSRKRITSQGESCQPQFKLLDSATETLADLRQVRVVCSAEIEDRVGDVVVQNGIDLQQYKLNPVILWQHDPSVPCARCIDIGIIGGKLIATAQFPPEGQDDDSDWVYGKIKSGLVNAVSIGFIPKEYELVNQKEPWGGYRFNKTELLEFSWVSLPCLREALIIGRDIVHATRELPPSKAVKDGSNWECSAARDLPLDESDTWDGGAAEASIFEWAGGDDFDAAKAAKGFLAHDASNPKLRGSYKLPFAHVSGGELKAVAAGIRAAASRLPQTDIPTAVQDSARAAIDHYEAKMKEGKAIPTKAIGEGTDVGGGALVPPGNCGRAKDVECGMKNPTECSMHAPEMKSIKAGRRISAANRTLLEAAMDHHASATKCIKDVMASNDPDGDGDTVEPDPQDVPEILSPKEQRLREARALKTALN